VIDLGDIDVAVIPRDELPDLLGKVVALEARVRLRLAEAPTMAPAAPDRNLDVAAAAARLNMSKRYLYRHADELGAVRIGSRILFPERRLARFLDRARRA